MKKVGIGVLCAVLCTLLFGCTVFDTVPEHTCSYSYADDYIRVASCEQEGCPHTSRRESLNIYQDVFVYSYDEEKEGEIATALRDVKTAIAAADRYDENTDGFVKDSELYQKNKAFEEIYDRYCGYQEYLEVQEAYAYVRYCLDCIEYADDYEEISQVLADYNENYLSLFPLVYETEYREYFFSEEDGWTQDDVDAVLSLGDKAQEQAALTSEINEIERAFRKISDPTNSEEVLSLYKDYVEKNNRYAVLAGYDTFYQYAQENLYGRSVDLAEIEEMQALVKEYIVPYYREFSEYSEELFENLYSDMGVGDGIGLFFGRMPTWLSTLTALLAESIETSVIASETLASYLERMGENATSEYNFFDCANDIFKEGNYYIGTGENAYAGAFTYVNEGLEKPILYMERENYSTLFTFVHEYGHYFADICGAEYDSYDIKEMQSIGDEFLLLTYLQETLQARGSSVYKHVQCAQMDSICSSILLACAVDEFERKVYEGSIPQSEYDTAFAEIAKTYGMEGNESYWRYVVIESPCYYLSYALADLSVLEVYGTGCEKGFDAAKEIYLKFFDGEGKTYCEESEKNVEEAFLEYAGLHAWDDEELFLQITEISYKEGSEK